MIGWSGLAVNVLRLATAQQCHQTGYMSARFQDWVLAFQQCNKSGFYISNVLRLGIAQQGDRTRYDSAMLQGWEHLSNVKRQGKRQECFKIGNSSAM